MILPLIERTAASVRLSPQLLPRLQVLEYRQRNQLWRLQGIIAVLRGERHWGSPPRRGFGRTTDASAA